MNTRPRPVPRFFRPNTAKMAADADDLSFLDADISRRCYGRSLHRKCLFLGMHQRSKLAKVVSMGAGQGHSAKQRYDLERAAVASEDVTS